MLSRVLRTAPTRALRAPVATRSYASHAEAHGEEYPTEEGFKSSLWSYGLIIAVGTGLYYRFKKPVAAESEGEEQEEPFMTRYIRYNLTPNSEIWRERNNKHLELAKQAAEDKLLFQEAERPRVRRLKYLGSFDQASPNNLALGRDAPKVTGLVIKTEADDFGASDKDSADGSEEEEGDE